MAKIRWSKTASLQLETHPKVLAIENRDKEYRGAIIMKNFQLIYYYDTDTDTVYIDTIWDMRMNPQALILTIK
ncbi:MAG: hypothetical protein IJ069_01240 [Prevotella sp.]|nr:hypothetical protein [Prevotella sp.]